MCSLCHYAWELRHLLEYPYTYWNVLTLNDSNVWSCKFQRMDSMTVETNCAIRSHRRRRQYLVLQMWTCVWCVRFGDCIRVYIYINAKFESAQAYQKAVCCLYIHSLRSRTCSAFCPYLQCWLKITSSRCPKRHESARIVLPISS